LYGGNNISNRNKNALKNETIKRIWGDAIIEIPRDLKPISLGKYLIFQNN